jgi:hypothetical protein
LTERLEVEDESEPETSNTVPFSGRTQEVNGRLTCRRKGITAKTVLWLGPRSRLQGRWTRFLCRTISTCLSKASYVDRPVKEGPHRPECGKQDKFGCESEADALELLFGRNGLRDQDAGAIGADNVSERGDQ